MTAPADLAGRFRRLISATGPIGVAAYMGEANAHYYAARDPLGAAGDFVTAPEISQMFGELVGLWCADLWDRAGRPAAAWVELGPGRGTLTADALRAMRAAGLTPPVHFVEASPALRAEQARAVPAAAWHDDPASLPADVPLLVIANEFFDALPVRQLVRTESGWRERVVVPEGDRFACAAGTVPMDAAIGAAWAEEPAGTIAETRPAAQAVMADLAARIAAQGGAVLAIDYGYDTPRTGSTLQAVRGHRKVDPFEAPGTADLTALVDFSALRGAAGNSAVHAWGPVGQGRWLEALGLGQRAAALAAARPRRAADVAAARRRLADPAEMGELFRVLALTAPTWPAPAGFSAEAR
ncbi:class I SAM-dependent methyltransferase [Parablastomonas sp. CN1-191]|uniref:class I SAM-dependent methyltransferase n=1 Tax=Parablastomonas sp. CN1-191 TaxID=3400908 RepID=UPI003BF8CE77